MKKCIATFFLFLGLMTTLTVFGENVNNPSWIVGKWSNSFISDLRESVIWTFTKDSIYVSKGMPAKKQCISRDYSGYKQTSVLNDNVYKVIFTKDDETIEYEFKQVTEEGLKKTAITYSLTVNGIKKVNHSTSAYSLFLKE